MKTTHTPKCLVMMAMIMILCASLASPGRAAVICGTEDRADVLMRWHRISLTLDGPDTSETADINPCFNYRLDVTFRGPGGQVATVPGFFAADGKAGSTGADSGNKWRAYFSPDQVGRWAWKVSMREGKDVSIGTNHLAGKPWKPLERQKKPTATRKSFLKQTTS